MHSPKTSRPGGYLHGVLADGLGRSRLADVRLSPALQPPLDLPHAPKTGPIATSGETATLGLEMPSAERDQGAAWADVQPHLSERQYSLVSQSHLGASTTPPVLPRQQEEGESPIVSVLSPAPTQRPGLPEHATEGVSETTRTVVDIPGVSLRPPTPGIAPVLTPSQAGTTTNTAGDRVMPQRSERSFNDPVGDTAVLAGILDETASRTAVANPEKAAKLEAAPGPTIADVAPRTAAVTSTAAQMFSTPAVGAPPQTYAVGARTPKGAEPPASRPAVVAAPLPAVEDSPADLKLPLRTATPPTTGAVGTGIAVPTLRIDGGLRPDEPRLATPATAAATMARVAQLERVTKELAAQLAAQQGQGHTGQEPRPAPVVIIQRVAALPGTPPAYWQRSYLGHTTLRGRR